MLSRRSPQNNRQLNLKHQVVCQERLSSHEDLEKLFVGPSHGLTKALVESLPVTLCHVDWDMTGSPSIQSEALECLLKRPLRHLCLRFRGDECALVLSRHLSSNIESLDLRGNQIGDPGVVALARAITHDCPSLSSLNLAYNSIGDAGVDALARLLQDPSCNLQQLNLRCNIFGEQSALRLVEALSCNSSLKELSLNCNQIASKVCQALVDTLHCNFSIKQIKLGATLTDTFSEERMEIEYLLKLNCGGRYLLKQNDLPCAIWPNVLSRSDQDLIYTFLSGKPELCSQHF